MKKGDIAYLRVAVIEINELGECYVTAVNQDRSPRPPHGVFRVQPGWLVSGKSILAAAAVALKKQMRRSHDDY